MRGFDFNGNGRFDAMDLAFAASISERSRDDDDDDDYELEAKRRAYLEKLIPPDSYVDCETYISYVERLNNGEFDDKLEKDSDKSSDDYNYFYY